MHGLEQFALLHAHLGSHRVGTVTDHLLDFPAVFILQPFELLKTVLDGRYRQILGVVGPIVLVLELYELDLIDALEPRLFYLLAGGDVLAALKIV